MTVRPPGVSSRWWHRPAEPLRQLLLAHVRSLTGQSSRLADFTQPVGDPGWFGPESVSWIVHADFVAMLTGGVRALLMQCLHPLALAGVWDHSNFREDLQGRLQRTALFVASTTYGPTALADAAVHRVRTIHGRVQGQAPDGRAYHANDPALLTWVHVAEVTSFLAAYQALNGAPLDGAAQDRYFNEQARVAIALGATDVPGSRAEMAHYLDASRASLHRSTRTDEVVRVLRSLSQVGLLGPLNGVFVEAGFDLLPPWARALLGEPAQGGAGAMARRAALRQAVPLMGWVLSDGVAAQAWRRCGP
jgi:uncharacterized protein (DUF2236 family)